MEEHSLNGRMSAEQSAILELLGPTPTMARMISTAAKLDRLPDGNAVRFAIVRNVTLEPGLPAAIKVRCAQRGMKADVVLGEFGAAQQAVFDPAGFLYSTPSDVVVLALQLRTLTPRLLLDFSALSAAEIDELAGSALTMVLTLAAAVRERSSALILVHNFELPLEPAFGILDGRLERGQLAVIRQLNLELARQAATFNSCYIVDVEHLCGILGYDESIDDRYWHIGRAPYKFRLIERLAGEYVKFAAAVKGKTKKCLVLDCDNTLWGGVIGEDGLNGIALGETHPGSAFVEFHSAILNLYHRGVLIAINSKNNAADALAVFEGHPSSLLRTTHFAATRINWEDKAANLSQIAAELNIGLDSMVFVDDNPFECQRVREVLPEVAVIELPKDPTTYARLLATSGYFDTLTISEEDRRRSEMYRVEARRSELRAALGSMDEYLASLNMVLTISLATPFVVPRIAQLTQKTNQFNLTTRRYSEGEIERMLADEKWRVYYAELSDKFDKAGVILVALVHLQTEVASIDSFLMSCRVIGRGVEQAVIAEILKDVCVLGRRLVLGEYAPTEKNGLVKDFYAASGFTGRPGSENTLWEFDLQRPLPSTPTWFREVVTNFRQPASPPAAGSR
jgi:FkbH-like protein